MTGDAPMQTFTPEEAARNAMASTPAVGSMLFPTWADDEERMQSVHWFALSARSRLIKALAEDVSRVRDRGQGHGGPGYIQGLDQSMRPKQRTGGGF